MRTVASLAAHPKGAPESIRDWMRSVAWLPWRLLGGEDELYAAVVAASERGALLGLLTLGTHLGFPRGSERVVAVRRESHSAAMKVLPVPCLEDNYAYLVFDEETGDAAAIDPVSPDQVLQTAQLNGAEVKMVLTTHHHWDHAGGSNGMKELLKEVPIYGGVKDEVEGCSHPVQHGDEFSISPTIRVKCLDTPCHTKGHISYFITSTLAGDKPVVFTGDTLFRGGCGRSFEGTPDQMYNSLCKTLASLPPETQVYCGHEDHSISSAPTRVEIDVRGEGHPTIRRSEARAEDGQEPAVKKLKRDHGDVEMGLRQTAEIVMVLVGVAALRGGAQPSPLECQLAAQAYEKLATLVAVSAPQDLVSKNALQSLIQQLTVPPPTPARPAAKLIAIQSSTASLSAPPTPTPVSTPSSAPSPPAQAGATPSPLSSPSVSPSPSPAPGLVPVSAGSSSEAGPAVTQAIATTSKAVVSAPKAGSPALETAKTLALEQVQTPSSSLDNAAPSSSPATTTNVPGKTRSSAPASSTSVPVAISTTPTLRTKSGGLTSSSADAQPTTTVTIKDQRGSQAPKALARQRGSKSVVPEQPVVLDPVEIHRQIALAVQLLLKPYIITTALSKTAGNYMNTPISCGICKVAANTTNNVLVCDGCECGFHLQCLQLSSTTSIPKGDWYCPKCVTTNAGRPQPPKYGPLRRGPAGQSGPKNSWSMQAGRGSDASKGQPPGKLLLQSRRKEVEPSSPPLGACTSSRPEAVARRHSMEEYARDRAQKSGVSEQEASDQSLKLEWLGPVVSSGQEKLYYSACSVGGVTVRLQDAAFFRPEAPDVPPYIARLQALWEDKSSGQKWVKVNWCYYPSDLPVNSGRPVICDPREVYESNHSDNNLVGSIQGPCLVLSPLKYQEELDRRSKNPKEDHIPLFLCQWFYDAPKGRFRASSVDFS